MCVQHARQANVPQISSGEASGMAEIVTTPSTVRRLLVAPVGTSNMVVSVTFACMLPSEKFRPPQPVLELVIRCEPSFQSIRELLNSVGRNAQSRPMVPSQSSGTSKAPPPLLAVQTCGSEPSVQNEWPPGFSIHVSIVRESVRVFTTPVQWGPSASLKSTPTNTASALPTMAKTSNEKNAGLII